MLHRFAIVVFAAALGSVAIANAAVARSGAEPVIGAEALAAGASAVQRVVLTSAGTSVGASVDGNSIAAGFQS
jgi:hypothetical protein